MMTSGMWIFFMSCIFIGMSLGVLLRTGIGSSLQAVMLIFFMVPITLMATYPFIIGAMLRETRGIAKQVIIFFKASCLYWKISPYLAGDLAEIIKKSVKKPKMSSQTYFMRQEVCKLSKECITHLSGVVTANA